MSIQITGAWNSREKIVLKLFISIFFFPSMMYKYFSNQLHILLANGQHYMQFAICDTEHFFP